MKIPFYTNIPASKIKKKDVLLGERIVGGNLTATYEFGTILE